MIKLIIDGGGKRFKMCYSTIIDGNKTKVFKVFTANSKHKVINHIYSFYSEILNDDELIFGYCREFELEDGEA